MYLHLYSGGSVTLLDTIAARVAEQVKGVAQPIIGYIPAASLDYLATWERVEQASAAVGTLRVIDLDQTDTAGAAAAIAASHALFMPGGNTYLLAQRMHRTAALQPLRDAVRGGTPLFTVSA